MNVARWSYETPSRTNRISPIAQALKAAPGLVIASIALAFGTGARLGIGVNLIMTGVLAILALIAVFSYLSWRRFTFWFDSDGDLRVRSGVITHQERRIQLSRLQTVDIVRPFVVRLLGLSEVRIEVAGEGESRASLQFLSVADAEALREQLLSGATLTRLNDDESIRDQGPIDESVIAVVPNTRLAVSLLLRGVTAGLVVLTVLVVAVTVLQAGPGALIIVLLTGGLPLLSLVGEYVKFHGFTIAQAHDGLRLRHGLTQTQAQTVPPGRVQAIELVSPLLWHRRSWVRVNLNVAGVGASTNSNGQQVVESVLIPVAPRSEALTIIARVLPGVDLDAIPLIEAPRQARWLAPFQWRRLAVGFNNAVFVSRRGWLTWRLAVIPHARTQSVRLEQGPLARRLGLASVHVDSTPGPVSVVALHYPAREARSMAEQQARRAGAARRSDG